MCPLVDLTNAAKAHRLRLDMQQAADVIAGPPQEPTSLDCPHRGEIIRQRTGDLCGVVGKTLDIYACRLHGECALHRFCRKQEERCCIQCVLAGENAGKESP